ncbi:MAG: hypothetical protein SFY70_12915 [Bacteroidia bacterium]|nr:hypothetical protein [Bacteroidia bacterium]
MQIAEFTVLISATGGTSYRIVPLEERLTETQFIPRLGDLLVASPDGEPVPGLDEEDVPVALDLDLVEVVSVIVDVYEQLVVVVVEEADAEPVGPPTPPPAPTPVAPPTPPAKRIGSAQRKPTTGPPKAQDTKRDGGGGNRRGAEGNRRGGGGPKRGGKK